MLSVTMFTWCSRMGVISLLCLRRRNRTTGEGSEAAPVEVEIAVSVDVPYITRTDGTIRQSCGGLTAAGVAFHLPRRRHGDLSGPAGRNIIAVGVDNAHSHAGDRSSDTPSTSDQVLGI